MKILVTGASGIVGRPLVERLLADGHEVIGLCRHPEKTDTPHLQWLAGDVSKPRLGQSRKIWQQLCEEIDTIFHLAARTDFKGKSLEDYAPINIDGVGHIKDLALAANAWLHHVSTAFVSGDWAGEFREEQLKEGQKFRNYYEESKCRGECLLREEPTPRYTVYRPAIILERKPTAGSTSVFGPFVFLDGVFRLCLGTIKRKKEEHLKTIRVQGNTEAQLPFVFDDQVTLALSYLAANKREHGKTYNLVPSTPLANNTLGQVFNQAFSRQVVALVNGADFTKTPPDTAEKILAKKTKMYTPYLDLKTEFARNNLEDAMGKDVLPAIGEEELLAAFSIFLSTKKDLNKVVSPNEEYHLDRYFGQFLAEHRGKPLIKNLASLSACLHVKITGYDSWTITIDKGVLTRVEKGSSGNFGYTTDGKTFLQVASGKISPQQGFFQGAIQIEANPKEALRTATALEEFFREYPYHFQL
ncbi:MAG TPA: NAD-dependent epimerase/dehydratase family protein [Desulfocapsa sulfexigens]|nr:NAD-dependent epimerase/dehydratase family protein [Desulfocapsa sulfexigens]